MPHTRYPQIKVFLQYLTFEKRYSRHTVISYHNDLEQFFQFLISQFDGPALTAISPIFIRSWLAEMRSDGISPKTLNRKISALKSFFKYQLKLGNIVQSPMGTIISPRVKKRLPAFVRKEEMEAIKALPKAEVGSAFEKDAFTTLTNDLLMDILYQTGIRVAELVGLKQKHIDKANSHVKVLGKGNKERIIPLANTLITSIENYLAQKQAIENADTSVLLVTKKGKPLYPKYAYLVTQRILSQVTTQQKKSPHILRHTFATHLTNNGADLNAVKELLGHSSLAATQVYTHNTIDKLKDIYKKAHPKA